MARYQVYLDKTLDAAMHEYADEVHDGVVNAALRNLVLEGLTRAGYPRVPTEAARVWLMKEREQKRQARKERAAELQRARRRRGVRRYEE